MNWKEDPRVLKELYEIEHLIQQGWSMADIADSLGYSIPTVYKKREKIAELARDEIIVAKDLHRAAMLKELIAVKKSAYESGNLKLVRALLADIRDLLGLDAPSRQEVSGPDGGGLDLTLVTDSMLEKLLSDFEE